MTSNLRHIATEPANLNHKVLTLDKSPRLKQRSRSQLHASDSDVSLDTASLSQESQADRSPNKLSPGVCPSPHSAHNLQEPSSKASRSTKTEWEILEGLREGQRCEQSPPKYEGFLLKRRKWPMKGWHKRFFVLDKGVLRYAKNQNDMARGKLHGSIDVGLSVISTKSRGRRIDIDADEYIYHLKVKLWEQFGEWVQQLRQHRLYRQHEIAYGSRNNSKALSPVEDVPLPLSPVLAMCQSELMQSFGQRGMTRSTSGHNSSLPQNKVVAWLAEASAMEQLNEDLTNLQQTIFQLSILLEKLKGLKSSASDPSVELPELGTSNIKKDRKRGFVLRRKKVSKGLSTDVTAINRQSAPEVTIHKETDGNMIPKLPSSINIRDMAHLSTSNPNLPTSDDSKFRPNSLTEPSRLLVGNLAAQERADEIKLREEFHNLAKEIHGGLRTALCSIHGERERLRQAMDAENIPKNHHSNMVTNLKSSLNQVLQQNSELRARLQRIHADSEIVETCISPEQLNKTLQQSLSYESSSVVSISEYFDAAEYLNHSDTSSEASLTDEEDDGSVTSENSEATTEYTPVQSDQQLDDPLSAGRRTRLAAPQSDKGDFNLWNLLCKNIGKDLSKVCMPVTLNEPLNTLQRLCEELEYSELLDKASEVDDPFEQMVYVAAFAVSGYGSLYHRASHKPFNPLLGETFESIREDKGFRFLAEQVCHHPPISVCHVEGNNYTLWQDMRIKTTFWGKSMEIQPIGTVNLLFTKHKTHYQWNKVTTCIHNVFSGQRWVDQYGELCITNGVANCKLTFFKTSYWSNKRHELRGTITNKQGKVIHHLFGHWNEGLYCGTAPSARCIWRPGAMPEDFKLYYGFTQFAIELNELDPETSKCLPPTDSRLRPDQRMLEEGDVAGAETSKLYLEQAQRDRKKQREESGEKYEPMWFRKQSGDSKEEIWQYNGLYWQTRSTPGFANIQFPNKLW